MSWIILIVAGLFEVLFTTCLGKAKELSGNEAYGWYAGFVISLIVSMGLLMKATETLPMGTAYAVWTGIGAVGTAIFGIIFLGESANMFRLLSLGLIVMGLIGLKLSS